MALHLLFSITDDPTLFNVGVYYNDETFFIELQKGGLPYSPPSNYQTSSVIVGKLSDYEFCLDTTRVTFVGSKFFPYAQRVEDAFSLYCQILSCDLLVGNLALTHESGFERKDGKLLVSATSRYTPILYSLDNSLFQESAEFTLLEPGDYTLYLKDRRGCASQQNFTINEATPPAAKWTITYKDPYQRVQQTVIYKQDYIGEPREVEAQQAVVRIDQLKPNDLRQTVIKGSECVINLISLEDFEFTELFSADERKHLVVHSVDDVLLFKGYVMPELWNEPYVAPPYDVSFSATDGLGTLKEFEFLQLNGEPITGIKSQLEVIVLCLKHLQLDLPITTAIHKYELRMAYGDPDDPLTQAFVDCDIYKGKDCATVLEEILKPYLARIYQQDGEWYITQIDIPGRAIDRPITFESEYREAYFKRNNCEFGLGVEDIFYSVPKGAFISEISVSDANEKRDAVFNLNGQALANNLGTCPVAPPTTGLLYCINSSLYDIRVDNSVLFSQVLPAAASGVAVVPRLVENADGPLLFSGVRVRKSDQSQFFPADRMRIQVMRANSGGTPAGQIPSSDGQGISPISIFKEEYESTTIEDTSNSYAPSANNYAAGQNYVIIFDHMPAIKPLHFALELYVNGQLASDSNRLSYNGSVTARIKRMEARHVETSFKLEVRPIGPTLGLDASPLSTEVAYGNEDYVEVTFSNIGWTSASFNPAISINISKVVADDPNVKLDSSSKAIWINI